MIYRIHSEKYSRLEMDRCLQQRKYLYEENSNQKFDV